MSLEQLAARAAQGDENALNEIFDYFKPIIKSLCARIYFKGADRDDVLQNAGVTLFEAVNSFDQNKNDSFEAFARLCIKRRLISGVKQSARAKHRPLSDYVSLSNTNEDGEAIESLQPDPSLNPLDILITEEQFLQLKEDIKKQLSPFEKEVFEQYLYFENYNDVANSLSTTRKAVDNAMQRIRKKISK